MIGFVVICNEAVYIVFPLSFTSLSDLSAPSPPWTHCTLMQIPSGQSSCCFKPKVTVLKRHASVVCVCLRIYCCISLYPQLSAQRSRLLVPPPTHTPYSVLSLKRRSLSPQDLTKGPFLLFYTWFRTPRTLGLSTLLTLAAHQPWLISHMPTSCSLQSTSPIPAFFLYCHTPACLVPIYQASSTLGLPILLNGGILLDLAYSDAHSNNKSFITWGFSLLFYSPNNQGLPLPACTRTLHYDERETVFLDIFLLFTSHLSLEHRR